MKSHLSIFFFGCLWFWYHIYETMPSPMLYLKLIEFPSSMTVNFLILNLPHTQKSMWAGGWGGVWQRGGVGKNPPSINASQIISAFGQFPEH